MGSVQSEEKCPQCGGIMFVDYYYKTNEEYNFCFCCGRRESWFIVRDSEGKKVFNKNGKARFKHKRNKGYGCICVAERDGSSTLYGSAKPVTKKKKKEFFKILDSDEVDKSNCYLLEWDEKSKTVISVYGKIPKFEEYQEVV